MKKNSHLENPPELPFRGFDSYRMVDKEVFFGRASEVAEAHRLITVYRGSFLFGESGSGKSSLVNAGLAPELMKRGWVVERLRVQRTRNQEFMLFREPNQLGEPSDDSLLAKTEQLREAIAADNLIDRCREVLKPQQDRTNSPPLILVLDQFEELVTLFEPTGRDGGEMEEIRSAQRRIVSAIFEILRVQTDLKVKLLLVFREDYLAKIQTLLADVPELRDQAMRLLPVSVENLDDIVRGPFQAFEYEREAFSDSLSSNLIANFENAFPGGRLNLSEVQTVCLELYLSDDREVLLQEKSIQGVMEASLEGALASVGVVEREAMTHLLSNLLTPFGTREVLSRSELVQRVENTSRIPRERIEQSLDRLTSDLHLIRDELRGETRLCEIVSEFLVPWIHERKNRLEKEHLRRRSLKQALIGGAIGLIVLLAMTVFGWMQSDLKNQALRANDDLEVALEKVERIDGLRSSLQDQNTQIRSERDLLSTRWNQALQVIRSTRSSDALNELANLTGEDLGEIEPQFEQLPRLLTTAYAGNRSGVWDVDVSPDGGFVGAAGDDKSVRVWSIEGTLEFAKNASSSKGGVIAVGFTPDSKQILAGSSGDRLPVFNVPGGEETVRLPFHRDAIRDIRASSEFMATASADGFVTVWPFVPEISKENLPKSQKIRVAKASVTELRFDKLGTRIVTSAKDESIQVWAPATGEQLGAFDGKAITRNCRFSPVDAHILAGGAGNKVAVVNTDKKWLFLFDERNAGDGHLGGVNGVAFSPDGQSLASVGSDGRCLIWDIQNVSKYLPTDYEHYPRALASLPTDLKGRILDVVWGDQFLVLGGEDGRIEGWNLSNLSDPSRDLIIWAHSGPVRGLRLISPTDLLSWSAEVNPEIPPAMAEAEFWQYALQERPDPLIKRWNLEVARVRYLWAGDWNLVRSVYRGNEWHEDMTGTMTLTISELDNAVSSSFPYDESRRATFAGNLSANGETLDGQVSVPEDPERNLEAVEGPLRLKMDAGVVHSEVTEPTPQESLRWRGSR